MNTATIRRGNGRGGRSGAAPGAERRPSKRKGGMFDRTIKALPLDEHQVHRLMTILLGLVFVALLWVAALFLGIPAMLWSEISTLAGKAGLQVAKVEVHGARRLDEREVYNRALDEVDHSMLSLDLAGLRDRLMTLGWVQDARVSRRLPDTLVIDIVEREPVAVWQYGGELRLVDAGGTVLAGVDPRSMPDLPLVVGPDANHQTKALARLMDAAPALKPMLKGATWVGNRRWDLKFQSGEILALPEGDAEAAAALVNFARMDGVDRLLGRGIIRFDMRDPARFVLRLPPGRSAPDVTSAPADTHVSGESVAPAASSADRG